MVLVISYFVLRLGVIRIGTFIIMRKREIRASPLIVNVRYALTFGEHAKGAAPFVILRQRALLPFANPARSSCLVLVGG